MVLERTIIGTNKHQEERESFRLSTQASSHKQGAGFLDQIEQTVVHEHRDPITHAFSIVLLPHWTTSATTTNRTTRATNETTNATDKYLEPRRGKRC